MFKTRLIAVAALLAGIAAPAYAVNDNLGFESGDLTGWTSSDASLTGVASSAIGTLSPYEGAYDGYARGGDQDVYTTLSQSIHLDAGQTLTGAFGFSTPDLYKDPDTGIVYNDDAYLKIAGNVIKALDVQSVGDFSSSPWYTFSFNASSSGDYLLEIGSANHGDGDRTYSSVALLDGLSINSASAAPEPAAWALMIGGFGFVGAIRRRRQASSLMATA